MSTEKVDFERFRLRPFVDKLVGLGEVAVHETPVPLVDLSAIIESTPKATLFKQAGPRQQELVAAISGSRRRIAAAFDTDERTLTAEVLSRIGKPQPVIEVASKDAPVHAVVRTGDQIDLTALPFHLQHEEDGGLYISSALDFAVDPASGKRNVGCRRLMLRNRNETTTNLTGTSDLKAMLKSCLDRGERLPVSFVIGVNPVDFCAAQLQMPVDEFALVASVRGGPLPMVRGISNGVPVPADAEVVLEGYLDELGYREMDGPYGEFWGYYGPMHIDPIFHVTAITMRSDALHQSVLHGGARMSRMETSQMTAIICEVVATRVLRAAGIEPAALHAVPSAPLFQHVRVALKRADAGKARPAIDALFKAVGMKHITIVDEDIDVFSDEEVEWAMGTRFRSDRDLAVVSGVRGFYEDPTADGDGNIAKIGFDATLKQATDRISRRRPKPPVLNGGPSNKSVRVALESGPKNFLQLMAAVGSRDGIDVTLALDELRNEGALTRLPDGEYALKGTQRRRRRLWRT
jgi:2,5-furandicarboxylate decarboxylase 1